MDLVIEIDLKKIVNMIEKASGKRIPKYRI